MKTNLLVSAIFFALTLAYTGCKKENLVEEEQIAEEKQISNTSSDIIGSSTLKSTGEVSSTLKSTGEYNINWIDDLGYQKKGSTKKRIEAVLFNGITYYFYKGVDRNYIYYSYNSSATPWLFTERKVPDEETKAAPAVAVFNGRLYIAFRGNSSEKIWYKYMNSDGTWSKHISTGSHYTEVAPALAASANYLYIIYKGRTGQYETKMNVVKINKSHQIVKTGWIPNNSIHKNGAPGATFYNGTLYVAYCGIHESAWYAYANESLNWSASYKIWDRGAGWPEGDKPEEFHCGVFPDGRIYASFKFLDKTRDDPPFFPLEYWYNNYIVSWSSNPKSNLNTDLVLHVYDKQESIIYPQTGFSHLIFKGTNVYAYYAKNYDDDIYEVKGTYNY